MSTDIRALVADHAAQPAEAEAEGGVWERVLLGAATGLAVVVVSFLWVGIALT